jgi:hypothetical protein
MSLPPDKCPNCNTNVGYFDWITMYCGGCDSVATDHLCTHCVKKVVIREHNSDCGVIEIPQNKLDSLASRHLKEKLLGSQPSVRENKKEIRPEQNGSVAGS